MIRIDLGLPAHKEMLDKVAGEEITFTVAFKLLDNKKTLPRVKTVANRLIKGFLGEKERYIDAVKLDLIYKSPDPCECLPEIHKLVSGASEIINEKLGGPVRDILGENRRIIKGMSTHYERSENSEVVITVTYKNARLEDLIHKAVPFVFGDMKR